jgi:hypothetical protein
MENWTWAVLLFLFLGGGAWLSRHFDSMVEWRRKVKAHKLGMTPPKPVEQPICGCGHNFSFHDPATSKCHATSRQATKWERDPDWDEGDDAALALRRGSNEAGQTGMRPVAWETVQCPCRRYVGPEPLTTLYAPELSEVAVEEPGPKRNEGEK